MVTESVDYRQIWRLAGSPIIMQSLIPIILAIVECANYFLY